jgi:hypothetical protein
MGQIGIGSQERSGRVALPRTKVVEAMAAAKGFAVEARRPARRAGVVRRRAEAMMNCDGRRRKVSKEDARIN